MLFAVVDVMELGGLLLKSIIRSNKTLSFIWQELNCQMGWGTYNNLLLSVSLLASFLDAIASLGLA